jgi:MoxR-like ATPase
MLAVGGEPGVGKTTFMRNLLRSVGWPAQGAPLTNGLVVGITLQQQNA